MAMLLGKKVGMTQVYNEAGDLVPVTVIQATPGVVTQTKTVETDGYNAIQPGFNEVKPVLRKKSAIKHAEKAKTNAKRFFREMQLADFAELEYQTGEPLAVPIFSEDKFVDVIGTSDSKGFADVMKWHGFGSFPASHRTERKHTALGSIASFASDADHGPDPRRGKRMASHLSNMRIMVKNHEWVNIDEDKNLLVVKGSIPGPAGNYCIIVRSVMKA